ncbi:MAG TPA: HEAT repeat domain-containing protein [Polyangiaceae bacterium]|nr:HEAT repeat domain-containing protein [Polyangiaceae bacterium]
MFGPAPLPRSLEASVRDAAHARVDVRLSAVSDLGRHVADDRSGRASLALREALASDASPAVRAAAALAMADTEQRSFVPALLRGAEDPEREVREMSLLALGELGSAEHPGVTGLVRAALADDAASHRFQAVIAAHRLNLPEVDSVLRRATEDADPKIRHISVRLMEERATSEDGRVAPSSEVMATAKALLRDPALAVRLAAAILLARSGDRAGEGTLAEAVEDPSTVDVEDEQAAVVLSGELRVVAARRGLERRAFRGILGRPRFSWEARIALARLGDPRARRAITRGLRAWSRDARTLAVVAAGEALLTESIPAIEAMAGDPSRAEPEAVERSLRLLRAAGA